MTIRITRYAVTTWGRLDTGEMLFGIRVHVAGRGWMNVSEDNRAVIYNSRKEARDYIAEMKRGRDSKGFKI